MACLHQMLHFQTSNAKKSLFSSYILISSIVSLFTKGSCLTHFKSNKRITQTGSLFFLIISNWTSELLTLASITHIYPIFLLNWEKNSFHCCQSHSPSRAGDLSVCPYFLCSSNCRQRAPCFSGQGLRQQTDSFSQWFKAHSRCHRTSPPVLKSESF